MPPSSISDRLCECGCGEFTNIAVATETKWGYVKGQPHRFKAGHRMRMRPVQRYRRRSGAWVHIARAEKALGKPLPPNAKVHHADGTKNPYGPLVICQDQAYHLLLHVRMRVKAAGGDPNTDRICHYCQVVKPMTAFTRIKNWPTVWHCRECNRAQCALRARKKAVA